MCCTPAEFVRGTVVVMASPALPMLRTAHVVCQCRVSLGVAVLPTAVGGG